MSPHTSRGARKTKKLLIILLYENFLAIRKTKIVLIFFAFAASKLRGPTKLHDWTRDYKLQSGSWIVVVVMFVAWIMIIKIKIVFLRFFICVRVCGRKMLLFGFSKWQKNLYKRISYLTRPFPYCQEAAFNLVTTKRIVVKRTIEEPRKIYIVRICNTISIHNLDFVKRFLLCKIKMITIANVPKMQLVRKAICSSS